jgi:hypothetical protein
MQNYYPFYNQKLVPDNFRLRANGYSIDLFLTLINN